MPTLLYLTDFYYVAAGRNYYEEDLYLTGRLKDHFSLAIGHPQQALDHLRFADAVIFRNTGPVMHYADYFRRFAAETVRRHIPTFNSFDGRGDQQGKGYLLQLTQEGYPVIPTISQLSHLPLLGEAKSYIVKLREGADSIGMERVARTDLEGVSLEGRIVQPYVDFRYEVSFYFIDTGFQYALYAPDKGRRWNLQPYSATADDLRFAQKFIQWNGLARGITRVDACRLQDGSLLLVELEDLNPYLSLDVLDAATRERFVGALTDALRRLL